MSASADTPLVARGVERRYAGVPALRGVDLTVERGEVVALLGHNGAGKTTLLRILATQLRPQAGTLHVFGLDARRRPPEVLRRVGIVGHESACYPDLTGEENLRFYAQLFELTDADARVAAELEWTRLGAAARRPARTYSRGMLQRLTLARALLHAPDLVLLDEPFTGLDPGGAALVFERLETVGRRGGAIVFSTHDAPGAAAVATRAVVLRGGRVAWTGPAVDAAQAYRDEEAR